MDPELLKLLVCPADHTPLSLARGELVEQLNQAIRASRLKNKAGQKVEQVLDGGLVRQDQALLYPIVDGIPILLVDEAIELEPSKSGGE